MKPSANLESWLGHASSGHLKNPSGNVRRCTNLTAGSSSVQTGSLSVEIFSTHKSFLTRLACMSYADRGVCVNVGADWQRSRKCAR